MQQSLRKISPCIGRYEIRRDFSVEIIRAISKPENHPLYGGDPGAKGWGIFE